MSPLTQLTKSSLFVTQLLFPEVIFLPSFLDTVHCPWTQISQYLPLAGSQSQKSRNIISVRFSPSRLLPPYSLIPSIFSFFSQVCSYLSSISRFVPPGPLLSPRTAFTGCAYFLAARQRLLFSFPHPNPAHTKILLTGFGPSKLCFF